MAGDQIYKECRSLFPRPNCATCVEISEAVCRDLYTECTWSVFDVIECVACVENASENDTGCE